MLSKDAVIAYCIIAFCFFFLSGSGLISGWTATVSGVFGTISLASALLKYSPLHEYFSKKFSSLDTDE